MQVNMLMSNKGTVLRCDVNGKIVMKVFLSGMPDVKLGLNDKLEVHASEALDCIPGAVCWHAVRALQPLVQLWYGMLYVHGFPRNCKKECLY